MSTPTAGATTIPVRAVRQTPTVAILVIVLAGLAGLAALGADTAVRLLAAAGATVFAVLLVEALLPHRLTVDSNGIRFRTGVHSWSLPWETLSGVHVGQAHVLGLRAYDVTFTREDGSAVKAPNLLLWPTDRGKRAGAHTVQAALENAFEVRVRA